MRRGGFLAVFLLLLMASERAAAEKIIWIDDKGGIHSEVRDVPGESERPQVELYVTSWCPSCKQAIRYLRSRGIAYQAYDIEKDRSAAKRKRSLDDRNGVPLAVINGEKILGFSPAAYEKALEARR